MHKQRVKRCKFSFEDMFYSHSIEKLISNDWWCSLGDGNSKCDGLKKDREKCPFWNKQSIKIRKNER